MRIALEAPPQHQERIFGRTHSLDAEGIEEFVLSFFEKVRHSSFHYEIRKNYEDFVKMVNEGLNAS
ncbi:MAG: hypothetical protein LBC41_04275, partial [Clostridiales bacterium]|jgi:hypothetical protein|nr:hypothetical protein [Clostridiales bacterium]